VVLPVTVFAGAACSSAGAAFGAEAAGVTAGVAGAAAGADAGAGPGVTGTAEAASGIAYFLMSAVGIPAAAKAATAAGGRTVDSSGT